MAITESDIRDMSRRTKRYDIDLIVVFWFCEESCPVDSIVETRVLEYHGEKEATFFTQKNAFGCW